MSDLTPNHIDPSNTGESNGPQQAVFIITGEMAEGKTRFTERLIAQLSYFYLETGGFYSPRVMEGDHTIGYDLVSLGSKEQVVFLRKNEEHADIGRFAVNEESFEKAHQWLTHDLKSGKRLIIIDEVGKWEIKGEGWHKELKLLFDRLDIAMIWVVRRDFVHDVVSHWNLQNVVVYDISSDEPNQVAKEISTKLALKRH